MTFVEDIFSLQPGHFLTLRLSDFDIKTINYWDLDKETIDLDISERDAIDKFSFLLGRSVQRRLRSDVTLGTSLSGGLDSSSIVSIICSLQREKVAVPELHTLSAVFPGFERDESGYIAEMVQQFPIKNHQIIQTLMDCFSILTDSCITGGTISVSKHLCSVQNLRLAKHQDIEVILTDRGPMKPLQVIQMLSRHWQELFHKSRAAASEAGRRH
jgi:asparagine synthase (glutamine-hydrolysing)